MGVVGTEKESSPPYSVLSSQMGKASQSGIRRAVGRVAGMWERTGSERERTGAVRDAGVGLAWICRRLRRFASVPVGRGESVGGGGGGGGLDDGGGGLKGGVATRNGSSSLLLLLLHASFGLGLGERRVWFWR